MTVAFFTGFTNVCSYWNPDYKPDQYNFVQYAVQRGYSVFFYDRLGVGTSTR